MTKMEYLDPQDGWMSMCSLKGQDVSQAATAVQEALKVAHSCLPGGVHGDLRAANTLVRRRLMAGPSPVGMIWEVRFIDFEVCQGG